MANELQGRRIAVLIAPAGTEQVEFTEPKKAVLIEELAEGRHPAQARSA